MRCRDEFAFIIEELLNEQESTGNKTDYYNSIIATIISIGSAEAFVIALCELIQRLAIAHLHILAIFMTAVRDSPHHG